MIQLTSIALLAKLISTEKLFHKLEINGIHFTEKEKLIIHEQFKMKSLHNSQNPQSEEMVSISSFDSDIKDSTSKGHIKLYSFFEWLDLDYKNFNPINLNEEFLISILQILKNNKYLCETYLNKYENLFLMLDHIESFLELKFIDYETNFKRDGSTDGLNKGNFSKKYIIFNYKQCN